MLVTVCVVTMVLSVAGEVTDEGPVAVLLWNGALELVGGRPVVVLFSKGTLEVVDDVTSEVVLLWNGALELVNQERVVLLFEDTVEVVEPVVLL